MSFVSRAKLAVRSARDLREVHRGGGPKRVSVLEVGRPDGLIFPTSEVKMDVETKSGRHVPVNAVFPVPFPWAWGYRALRKMGVPLISQLDPEDLKFGVGVPDWAWPGGGGKPPEGNGGAPKTKPARESA